MCWCRWPRRAGGFKDAGRAADQPGRLPASWDGGVYWEILAAVAVAHAVQPLVIAVFTVGLTLIAGSMAAFVFAHVTSSAARAAAELPAAGG